MSTRDQILPKAVGELRSFVEHLKTADPLTIQLAYNPIISVEDLTLLGKEVPELWADHLAGLCTYGAFYHMWEHQSSMFGGTFKGADLDLRYPSCAILLNTYMFQHALNEKISTLRLFLDVSLRTQQEAIGQAHTISRIQREYLNGMREFADLQSGPYSKYLKEIPYDLPIYESDVERGMEIATEVFHDNFWESPNIDPLNTWYRDILTRFNNTYPKR